VVDLTQTSADKLEWGGNHSAVLVMSRVCPCFKFSCNFFVEADRLEVQFNTDILKAKITSILQMKVSELKIALTKAD